MFTVLTTIVIIISFSCVVSLAQNRKELDFPQPKLFYYEHEDNTAKPSTLADTSPELTNELDKLSDILLQVLAQSWGPEGVPILYVEEQAPGYDNEVGNTPWKRSRYYRRYPWKRQNSRSRTYEADNRYLCQPSREDVFKLLVALHETKTGNGGQSINFCNRRRSAGAIFTNIRFLGKK